MPRQLAAILFSDIVGYTTLMGKDSSRAIDLVRVSVGIQKPLVEKHNGKWLKEMGDGAMAQFGSALDAVKCAIEIQEQARAKLDAKLRIGIHLGDITIENDDIYGDGVNVAARLESIADPGGIYVSESVQRAIRGESVLMHDLGQVKLKNVDFDARIHAIQGVGLPTPRQKGSAKSGNSRGYFAVAIAATIVAICIGVYFYWQKEPVYRPLESSIAVLPFTDMSEAKDQEYFSDGISEEIINALAKVPELKVSGRTSSFSFKGKNSTVQTIGEQLGVKTILEGSVRKSGDNLRITAQLINVRDGFHIWTETYDREMTDIFKVQDEITASILKELKVRLGVNQQKTVAMKETDLDGYNLYLKARQKLALRGEYLFEARDLFTRVTEIDPSYSPAFSGLGRTLSLLPIWTLTPSSEVSEPAKESALRAIQLDSSNAEAYSVYGAVSAFFEWDWETGGEFLEKSYEMQPADTEIANFLGDYYIAISHPDMVKIKTVAMELDPLHAVKHVDLSVAYASLGDWSSAADFARRSIELNPRLYWGNRNLVECLSKLGQFTEAEVVLNNFETDTPQREIIKLEMMLFLAIARSDSTSINELVSILENAAKEGREYPAYLADFYLSIGKYSKAAEFIELAYKTRDYYLISTAIIQPEGYPPHPDLDKAFDKPELQTLYEIRRGHTRTP